MATELRYSISCVSKETSERSLVMDYHEHFRVERASVARKEGTY